MATTSQLVYETHEYVVIGAGISGLQTGIILGQNNKDFIILEATDKIGGRIGTDKLSDVLKQEFRDTEEYPKWLSANRRAMDTPIEYGATWISEQHEYMLKMLKQLKVRVFSQYYDGLTIYGKQKGQYEEVRSLGEHYKNWETEIQSLLDKIDNIKSIFLDIQSRGSDASAEMNKFIDTYDMLTVKDFIMKQLHNDELADDIINQIETLECLTGDKLSMMQLFDDDSSLQMIRFYTGKVQNTIDGMRVQNGMITVPKEMLNKMMKDIKKHKPEAKQEQYLVKNVPVVKIENQDDEIKIYIKNSNKVYVCKYVFFSVPIAVINQIEITRISSGKKLIVDNQESGVVHRVYLVFEHAFWRYKYTGYGVFSHSFPFCEMTQLSPSNLACGVLAFVFVGGRYEKWIAENPEPEKRLSYLKEIVAQLFLKGDSSSPQLQNCFSYTRSYSENPYIRAGYQATTKCQIWKQVKDQGQDYGESYCRDENKLIFIGSEFSEEFSTYMEGAVRLARQRAYGILNMVDPWKQHFDQLHLAHTNQ